MAKKIANIIIAVILLATVIFAGIQSYRVTDLTRTNSSLSESVDRYRSDLELARRTNDRYADAYRQTKDTNTELGECLSEHVSTLSQLRSQLQAVRTRYERMQEILESLSDLGDISDSDDRDIDTSGGTD